jgi:GDP-4-dehydro-6-deoxy-D-mannose reductase
MAIATSQAMRTVVTGLSGFVGSHCAKQMPVIGLDLDGAPVELRNAAAVRASLDATKPEMVIHLAAQSSVPAAFSDPAETLNINLLGTLHLLQGLDATGFRGRMLYVSSGDVYGLVPDDHLPVTELQPPAPRNPYAVSKAATELLCLQWSLAAPYDILIARPFNHVGPRQDTRFAVADFARQIARMRLGLAAPTLQVGDIDATRDFTDVRDVVRAYAALLAGGRRGEIYNVCSGQERSLRSVIEELSRLAGVEPRHEVQAGRLRASEQRRMCGCFDKLNHHVGWAPEVPFRETLSDILNQWRSEDLE